MRRVRLRGGGRHRCAAGASQTTKPHSPTGAGAATTDRWLPGFETFRLGELIVQIARAWPKRGRHVMKLMRRIFACLALLCTPAGADTIYNVDYFFASHLGYFNYITGTIITDGGLGALAPEDILGWNITRTSVFLSSVTTAHASSDTGGTLTWTPASLTATPTELVFDFGPRFVNGLDFGIFGFIPGCPSFGQCGTIYGVTLDYTTQEFHHIAQVPGPIVGTGLPGLVALGIFLWRRRRSEVDRR